MDILELRITAEKYLAPLLSAKVLNNPKPCTPLCSRVSFLDPSRIAIKAKNEDKERIVIHRIPGFNKEELQIAKDFTEEISNIYDATKSAYRADLFTFLPARAISRHLGGMEATQTILRQFEKWAGRTYEGGAISSSIGIDPQVRANDIGLAELFTQDFSAVLSNGFDTLLVTSSDGHIAGAGQLSASASNLKQAPYRLNAIADWCTGERIAIVLNRLGEQLVFRNNKILFAKRRGEWRYYPHEMYVRQIKPPQNRILREAIYQSCIDISFARTGGCIIVVKSNSADKIADFISDQDRLDGRHPSLKTKTVKTIASARFQELDRRLRQELLALDGATVLNHEGDIIAAGAIIRVPSGSDGGGRMAAAKEGSTLGLGVKISEDGEIIAFKNEERLFAV